MCTILVLVMMHNTIQNQDSHDDSHDDENNDQRRFERETSSMSAIDISCMMQGRRVRRVRSRS
jgi:hypothetical protein